MKSLVCPTTDSFFESLHNRYQKIKRPVVVNFRRLVPWRTSIDYASHLLHPYPAKLLVHIPHFWLANTIFSRPGETVLDPFCGSGTVLVESALSGRNALGADSNPLARLITRVKTTPINPGILEKALLDLRWRLSDDLRSAPPDVVNIAYWFHPHVIKQLICLSHAIRSIEDEQVREFLLVCFSRCVRKVSLADPRLSVPVRLKADQYSDGHWLKEKTVSLINQLKKINVYKEFFSLAEANVLRMNSLSRLLASGVNARVPYDNARHLEESDTSMNKPRKLKDGSVDFIITSPPYAGAQKYIRASSLNLGWLEICGAKDLKSLENGTIGREHFHKGEYGSQLRTGLSEADKVLEELRSINPLRSYIMGTYLLEMKESIKEMARVIKPSGYMVLVMGNNRVCGRKFRTQDFLCQIAEEVGFQVVVKLVDTIKSRGLMTKRNKTAAVIDREWVVLFRKPGRGK